MFKTRHNSLWNPGRPAFCSVRSLGSISGAVPLNQNARLRAQATIKELDSIAPFSKHLTDTFNRRHNYLRISLTERCNLRCFYCMPSEGIDLSPEGHLLTNDEILRLATLFVKSGVTKIRLTGGEPTVRKGIADIISNLNKLKQCGLKSIGMTTNGLSLHRKLPQFIENGLTHLNLSLDTMDPFKFELITRRRGHEAVLKALEVAVSSRLESVKVNVVVIKGLNDSEVLDFVEMSKDLPVSIRFIEFMPFTGNKWDQKKMVPSADLLDQIRKRYPNAQRAPDELNDTARSWMVPGYRGTFGFISSMSDHFCSSCNRLRLTADGQIKVCLFDATEVSLRDKMRLGASDSELLETIGLAVSGKKEKHAGMQDIDVVTNRPMILIDCSRRKFSNTYTQSMASRFTICMPFNNASHASGAGLRMYSTSTGSLTHLDEHGRASMVDIGEKQPTKRSATASGRIYIPENAYKLVTSSYPTEERKESPGSPDEKAFAKARRKGDALTVAQLAAIMGAKATSSLIPLCHPLALSKINVTLVPERVEGSTSAHYKHSILCTAIVTCEGKTGVEMEALTAVSIGLLTVWDMLKAIAGKEMEIGTIKVVQKSGGRSGDFVRNDK